MKNGTSDPVMQECFK
jgi:hypothetical protein